MINDVTHSLCSKWRLGEDMVNLQTQISWLAGWVGRIKLKHSSIYNIQHQISIIIKMVIHQREWHFLTVRHKGFYGPNRERIFFARYILFHQGMQLVKSSICRA